MAEHVRAERVADVLDVRDRELIKEKGAQGPPEMLEHQKKQLAAMVLLVRGDLPGAVRNQVRGSRAVIDVHARDVMIRLTKERVSDI